MTYDVVTEEGIANLLLCRTAEEREQAIRGVAGFTDAGRARDRKMVENLRDRGVIRRPEDLKIDPLNANRQLLAACSIKDLVTWSGGLYRRPVNFAIGDQARNGSFMEILEIHRRLRAARPVIKVMPLSAWWLRVIWSVLERVLVGTECEVNIKTPVEGFGEVWRAVVNDFIERHSPGGLRISINDGGARLETVSLRLAQSVRLMEAA